MSKLGYLIRLVISLMLNSSRSIVVAALKLPKKPLFFTRNTSNPLPGSSSFGAAATASSVSSRREMSASSSSSAEDAAKKALMSCPTITLRDNTPHPAIGFGT